MRDICAQGAAHAVWKEIMTVVVMGSEEIWEVKASGEVMSVMVVILRVRFASVLLLVMEED